MKKIIQIFNAYAFLGHNLTHWSSSLLLFLLLYLKESASILALVDKTANFKTSQSI